MSYYERDKTKIEGYHIFFSLSDGTRVMVRGKWKKSQEDLAEYEASRLPEGRVSPIYGWKIVETKYPTCPECGHQGESAGIREFNYNGGGEHFRCLNPKCKNKWVWS